MTIRSFHLCLAMAWVAIVSAASASDWTDRAPAAPEKFEPEIVARADTEESMLTTTAGGSEIYWARSEKWFPYSRVATIWTAQRAGDGWEARRAAFSTGYSDVDPFVSPDGNTIIFASMRPLNVPRQDFDLYVVQRTGSTFGRAKNLGEGVNSPDDDLFPSVASDGTLYFGSLRGGGAKIYRSRRLANGEYGPAEALEAPVNIPGVWSFNPFISADGRTLIFTSLNRPGGYGKGDIWVATGKVAGRFDEVRNLGPAINTAEEEFHPTLSRDRSALFFIRRNTSQPGGNADVYWVSTRKRGPVADLFRQVEPRGRSR
jgi:Tol biopolymer transport system component